jgi:hypothetical protein
MLTLEHKECWVQDCQDLLNQYEAEGDSFLDRITSPVTRCGVTTMSRSQNSSPGSGDKWIPFSKKKFRTLPSAGKVICTVCWDRQRAILLDFLEPGHTIKSDRYIAMLTKLKAWISRVSPETKKNFLLQHGNARSHTSIVILGWTVGPHSQYSPDLAHSDFHLFGPIKDGLCGHHFPSYVAIVKLQNSRHLHWCRFLTGRHAGIVDEIS